MIALKQSPLLVAFPLPRILVILALIALRASYDKIGRIIRAALRDGNNMVNVILDSKFNATPIAFAFLSFVLALNISNGMLPAGFLDPSASVSRMGGFFRPVCYLVVFSVICVVSAPLCKFCQSRLSILRSIPLGIFASLFFCSFAPPLFIFHFTIMVLIVILLVVFAAMLSVVYAPLHHVRLATFLALVTQTIWGCTVIGKELISRWQITLASIASLESSHTTPRLVSVRHDVCGQSGDETTFSGATLDHIRNYNTLRGLAL